jgi:hypothetical protein
VDVGPGVQFRVQVSAVQGHEKEDKQVEVGGWDRDKYEYTRLERKINMEFRSKVRWTLQRGREDEQRLQQKQQV